MSGGENRPAAADALALETRNLHVRLGDSEVLRGVDLRVPQGRWSAVVGPNGAGKSTLLKALALLLPYAGRVALLGRDAATLPGRVRARQLAWMGQTEHGGDDLSVHDVAMLGRLPHQSWLGAPDAADHAAVERALRQTQAWEWRDRALGQLSAGERQRVLLARALAVDAPVLLMDEPLANLDPPHQADWLGLVRDLVRQGRTVVSVLHELAFALQADTLIVMAGGRLHHQGAADDPTTHEALGMVFEQRIRVHAVDGQWVVLPRTERTR